MSFFREDKHHFGTDTFLLSTPCFQVDHLFHLLINKLTFKYNDIYSHIGINICEISISDDPSIVSNIIF
jgi:hypothetical protein